VSDCLDHPSIKQRFLQVIRTTDFRLAFLLVCLHFLIQTILFHQLGRFIVDAGKEMVAPWLLLDGQMLYRDVFWLYGPWAPYFNAGLFYLFGVHNDVLLWTAKALGGGVVLGVFLCLRTITTPTIAFIGGFCALTLSTTSNYFAWPYSFSNLWATAGSLFAVWHLMRWQKSGNKAEIFWAGVFGIIVVSCKFIIILPVLVAFWGMLFTQHTTAIKGSPGLLSRLFPAFIYTAIMLLAFTLPMYWFYLRSEPESFWLQAGTLFHARHLMAAELYNRLRETVFLQNGLEIENFSAAIAVLLCPFAVMLGICTWCYAWIKDAGARAALLAPLPIVAFAAGNLLQMNSSVHAPYVFPACVVALFWACHWWNRAAESRISRFILLAIWILVPTFCITLAVGRLVKIQVREGIVETPRYRFNWPPLEANILQSMSDHIRQSTKPTDRIIILAPQDYLYLLADRKPALGYLYTWYEPFHNTVAAQKVIDSLRSSEVQMVVTHLEEPASLAFAPQPRNHPIYQELRLNYSPEVKPKEWGLFIVWHKRPGAKLAP
jgi:hypothetical protein